MQALVSKFRGSSLDARFMRSSMFTLGGGSIRNSVYEAQPMRF